MNAPTVHYQDDQVTVWAGDCLDVLRQLPDASVDAVVTDPPAAIAFMGRAWDGDRGGRQQWVAWFAEVMAECLRVAKPGAHALVWGLPRTSHWTACGLEDAGWDIRDRISHLFGNGFPKSLDVSKAIDNAAGAVREVVGIHRRHGGGSAVSGSMAGPLGTAGELPLTAPATHDAHRWNGWGTALKPAAEDWWVARKPLAGTVASTVLAHGTGALNIDACRTTVGTPDGRSRNRIGEASRGDRYATDSADFNHRPGPRGGSADGRWPTNVVLTHSTDCNGRCTDGCPVAELDAQSGVLTSGKMAAGTVRTNRDGWAGAMPATTSTATIGDSGGASRFFPTFRYEAKADSAERPKVDGIGHPTVKPLELMRFLVRLVTPPGGLVLDPFAGSGTTAEACLIEGFRCTTIEREPAYLPLITARLSKPLQPTLDLFAEGPVR